MAVLTPIDEADVTTLLAAYGSEALRSFEGLAAGSVNSNFAVETAERRLFLRLYEEQDLAGARAEAAMLERLARAGVPTPPPLRRTDEGLVSVVRGKPAALFPWRAGTMRCQAGVTADDTRRLGAALARMHLAGAVEAAPASRFRATDLALRLDRIEASGDERFAPVVPDLRVMLEKAQASRSGGLPGGLIHGDLFRDNVLWSEGGEISALLDFESACGGPYAYDLMVTVLSWCFGDGLDSGLAWSLCRGYAAVRTIGEAEAGALHAEGTFAALRFAITRITDYALRTDAVGARVVKDWSRFAKRFRTLQELGPIGLRVLLGV